MDDIIDEVVAESATNDNLEEIIQVATEIVGSDNHGAGMEENIDSNGGVETPATGISVPASSEEDNMDYDSDDDDDSKSNNSSLNNRNNQNHNNLSNKDKKKLKGEVKRSHHNVLERKRRDLIKDSFTKLKDAIPTLSAERASRAQILKKAADFIQAQHQKNESTRADLKELIKQNAELENKKILLQANSADQSVKQEPQ